MGRVTYKSTEWPVDDEGMKTGEHEKMSGESTNSRCRAGPPIPARVRHINVHTMVLSNESEIGDEGKPRPPVGGRTVTTAQQPTH